MAAVTYPVVLNETGQLTNQKIAALGPKIDADRVETSEQLAALGAKIDQHRTALTQHLATLNQTTDAKLAEIAAKIPSIVSAMDKLDIIYYVEPD